MLGSVRLQTFSTYVKALITVVDMPKALPMVDISAPVCCAPVSAGPLDEESAVEIALRLKALADPTRLRLLSLLMAARPGQVCTCDLAPGVGLSEATVSHHLTKLRKAGMIASQRDGMNVYHQVRPEAIDALCQVLSPTAVSGIGSYSPILPRE